MIIPLGLMILVLLTTPLLWLINSVFLARISLLSWSSQTSVFPDITQVDCCCGIYAACLSILWWFIRWFSLSRRLISEFSACRNIPPPWLVIILLSMYINFGFLLLKRMIVARCISPLCSYRGHVRNIKVFDDGLGVGLAVFLTLRVNLTEVFALNIFVFHF